MFIRYLTIAVLSSSALFAERIWAENWVGQDSLRQIELGELVEGEITDRAKEVRTPELDANYVEVSSVGLQYRVSVEQSGPYTIDLRSFAFDAYLVLHGAQGEVVAEDDDSGVGAHARLVTKLEADIEYTLSAIALHGQRGDFMLAMNAGLPKVLSEVETARLEIENSTFELEYVESYLGADHPRVARSLNHLGQIHYTLGEYADAQRHYARALALYESQVGPDHPETAIALNKLGEALEMQGDLSGALQLYERALDLQEKNLDPSHPNIEITLRNITALYQSVGDLDSALPIQERLLSLRESQLGDQALELASILFNLASIHRAMGDPAGAVSYLERQLGIYENHYGPDHPKTSSTMSNLGAMFDGMGEYYQARRYLERALVSKEASLGPDDVSVGITLINLGMVLKALWDFDGAQIHYERALSIFEEQLGDHHPRTALALNNLGSLFFAQGNYAVASQLFERALKIRETQLEPEHPDTAQSLNNLASLYRDQGQLESALPLFERALEIYKANYGPNHPETALGMGGLASVLKELGDVEGARRLIVEAHSIFEGQFGEQHPLTLSLLSNLSDVTRALGDADGARSMYTRLLAIDEARFGSDHPLTATTLHNLALIVDESGELDEAASMYERALVIRESQFGLAHPETLRTLRNLALLFVDQKHDGQAWELLWRGHRGMRSHLETYLASRTHSEGLLYAEELRFDQEILLSLSRSLEGDAVVEQGMESLVAWKGQVGRSARTARRGGQDSEVIRETLDRIRLAQAELSSVAYDTTIETSVRNERMEGVRDELRDLEIEHRRLAGVEDSSELPLSSILEQVPPNAALINFFVQSLYEPELDADGRSVSGSEMTEPHLLAWIARPGAKAVSVDLGFAAILEELTRNSVARISQSSRGEGISVAVPSHELRKALWDPLVKHLEGVELVILSKDSFLGGLSFGVMQNDEARYLLEDYSFVDVHDFSMLPQTSAERAPDYSSLLAVGGITYDQRAKELPIVASASRSSDMGVPSGFPIWRALAGTEVEITAIGERHEAMAPNERRTILRGELATESRVVKELPNASVVHFATHGFFNPEGIPSMLVAAREEAQRKQVTRDSDRPTGEPIAPRVLTGLHPSLLSGLVFAGANLEQTEGRDDGYLTAADVEWIDLSNVELITLSACETGLGRPLSGEGMSGFQTTLHAAGAKTVVTSLWKVPDDETCLLMTRFYDNLWANGMGKLAALREAQLWMLKRNRSAGQKDGDPASWGAFVLSGDWR